MVVRLSLMSINMWRNSSFLLCKSVPILTGQRYIKRWASPTLMELKKRQEKLGPQPPQRRSEFLEWNYNAELYAFGKRLNEEFHDDLLRQAFTHRSYILQEEQKQRDVGIEEPSLLMKDNKTLAKLGESFIEASTEQYVRAAFPHFPDEGIKAVVEYLSSEDVLSEVSQAVGAKDLILSADFPATNSTLSTTVKALIGVLLESSGVQRTDLFVRDFIVTYLANKDIANIWFPEDPMALLKEHLEKEGRGVPEPRLINEAGKNTILSVYQVVIYSDKQFLGVGNGESIDIATEMAACDAVRRLLHITDTLPPLASTFSPPSEVHNVVTSKG